MHISDKTISKWERGLGCPDVSLLGELSELFEVNIEKILLGDLELNDMETGKSEEDEILCLSKLRKRDQHDWRC